MPDLDTLANWANIGAVIIAAFGIMVTVWQNYRARVRRSLACEFYPIRSPLLIGASETVESDIEIRYKGQVIENLFTIQARLKNIGNKGILKSEVVEPVTFTFGVGTEVLGKPQIVYTIPPSFKFAWKRPRTVSGSKQDAFSLDFELFQENDELLIEFICVGRRIVPEVSARIVGINRIELVNIGELMARRSSMAVISFLIISALGALIAIIILKASIFCLGLAIGFVLAGIFGWLLFRLREAQVMNASWRD